VIPALVGVPVKPFGVAKRRLGPAVDAATRSLLGRAIAAETLRAVAASGAVPVVVTGDAGVASWARTSGWEVIAERPGSGLDGAAAAVVTASPRSWAVLHADLPLVGPADLAAAWDTAAATVLAPSRDGGTNLFIGSRPTRFAYGPGSFTRHLAGAPGAVVVVRPGLALDLDTPADLAAVLSLGAPPALVALLGSDDGASPMPVPPTGRPSPGLTGAPPPERRSL
jgi:2-phospho-L-lactate guanylyltransferase